MGLLLDLLAVWWAVLRVLLIPLVPVVAVGVAWTVMAITNTRRD